MAEAQGLRQRKKARTRGALVENGLRLFDRQGYEATTVAQIAAASDVAPATFFTYFPAKEALVFADQDERVDALRRVIAERRPEETARQAVMRGVGELLDVWAWREEPSESLAALRARVVLGTPALRAAALGRLFASQQVWGDALEQSFPGRFAPDEAHAVIGAVVGAAISASMANLQRGADRPLREVVLRAADIALSAVD